MCLVCLMLGLAECSGATFECCRRFAAVRLGLRTRAHPRAPRSSGARRVAVLDFAVRADAPHDLGFRGKREDQQEKNEDSHRCNCSDGPHSRESMIQGCYAKFFLKCATVRSHASFAAASW